MFLRSFSKDRVTKPKAKRPSSRRLEAAGKDARKTSLSGSIVTVVVGASQRLFAAHEEILARSPFFAQACKELFFDSSKRIVLDEEPETFFDSSKRIVLDEEPETFSCVLEYLYKNDYTPRLMNDKRRWYLDAPRELQLENGGPDPTMYHSRVGDVILRDTAVYCAAERFGLDDLKRLALRKQGLQIGIPVAVILRSARFAYDNTPEHDSALRAHFLALIIRSRKTFKRSGTMQQEMELGGQLWWDLFVAMCNHMDDLQAVNSSPRTI